MKKIGSLLDVGKSPKIPRVIRFLLRLPFFGNKHRTLRKDKVHNVVNEQEQDSIGLSRRFWPNF